MSRKPLKPSPLSSEDLEKLQTLTDQVHDTKRRLNGATREAASAQEALTAYYRMLPRQYDIPIGHAVNVDTGEIVAVRPN